MLPSSGANPVTGEVETRNRASGARRLAGGAAAVTTALQASSYHAHRQVSA